MTSTSMPSRSESVPEALSVGGGASMAAAFFLFLAAKKLPKKPELPSGSPAKSVGLAARAGVAAARGLPVLGSTWTGRAGLCFSLTIAMACAQVSPLILEGHTQSKDVPGARSKSRDAPC